MFEFFVVTRESNLDFDLRRIPITQPVQKDLSALFAKQCNDFLNIETEMRDFEATFRPEGDEMFELQGFELPSIYATSLVTPQSFAKLDNAFQRSAPIIKAVLAVDPENQAFYFQSFNRGHVLDRRRTLLLTSNTFQQLSEPAVQIDKKLAAVFRDDNLYFRSFHAVKQFLPLDDVFREATDEDVRSVLSHESLIVENPDEIIQQLSPRARKRFSLVIAAGVLDHPNATPTRIQQRSKKFRGLDVKTKRPDGIAKLVFPTTNRKIEYLLRFLAEEFYISEITEQPRATNSHEKYRAVPPA